MIYFDWNASTPVDPEVREAMLQALVEVPANPSSAHALGRRARSVIETARASVARLIEAETDEIVFTGGGSEANNLAIAGLLAVRPGHVVTSAIEHPSVVDCLAAAAPGDRTTAVAPDRTGAVSPADVEAAFRADTVLLSVMRAQNETGVLQPVAEVASRARARSILVHTDAVQAAGKTPVSVRELGVDLLSLSAHKMRGPKGVGALFVRRGVTLTPLIRGGGHERGLRGGTENVAGIVGLGKATELAHREITLNVRKAGELRERFESGLAALVDGVTIHGREATRLSNTSCVSIAGVPGHALMMWLDARDIAVSTGAACHAGNDEGSAVLLAMGVSPELARGALRVSFGPASDIASLEHVLPVMAEGVRHFRGKS